jgi:lysophospholipase L1-like esterase
LSVRTWLALGLVAAAAAVSLALWPGVRASGEAVKIMPLGDSITQGSGGEATYRYFLWHRLLGAGYRVDFVGSLTGVDWGDPKYPDFDQDHEGHSSYRADDVLLELDGWLSANLPEVVLVHLGTNDVTAGETTASTIQELGRIVDVLRSHNPGVIVLLAQIIPCEWNDSAVRELNAEVPLLAAEKSTAQSPVLAVDQWTGFSAAEDTSDGVHPNESGERKMAARWYEALVTVLPAPPAGHEGSGEDCGPRRGRVAASLLLLATVVLMPRRRPGHRSGHPASSALSPSSRT